MLKEYRKKNTSFTQVEMAKLLKISRRTYQKIEKENDCNLSQAKSISEIFGDSIENIFFKKYEK